ncbi:hypothetical protein KFE25_009553 [Diacronema lutheri]|uniref:DUF7906 domain-containing protein n=1 Tax=Diacronema lutheri TaxID=2081491 RepID=A0A8J5XYG7_DIALT|nr:hypothetical protein KFE25_009553 [Diacronema lutheri]
MAPDYKHGARRRHATVLLALAVAARMAVCQPAESALAEHLAVLDPIGDPWARDDAFLRLSERELGAAWSAEGAGSLASQLDALSAIEHHSFVDVRLVCFAADGNATLELDAAKLGRFLDAMSVAEPVHLTAEEGTSLDEAPRALHISRTLSYHVSFARAQLCVRVTDALRQAAAAGLRTLPVAAVDDVLAADHAASAEVYTIYLLNPVLPGGLPYAYVEPAAADKAVGATPTGVAPAGAGAADTGSRAAEACPISSWVARGRYAWLDVAAGPVTFGPATSGIGPVLDSPLARARARASGESLELELAATVVSAAGHLLAPPVERLAPASRARTIVRVFELFVDGGAGARDTLRAAREGSGVDYTVLAQQLARAALSTERVLVESVPIAPGACVSCELAFAQALRARSSAIVADGETTVQTDAYVSARALQRALARALADIEREALASGAIARAHRAGGAAPTDAGVAPVFGSAGAAAAEADANVLVAFVVTVTRAELLLLDRAHQARGVGGMALALRQPGSPPAPVDFRCGAHGMRLDTADATRALLGALLQAHWGVGPVHVRWDAHLRAPRANYLWATGHTPFGPFSSSRELSFAYVDAARRARVYALLEPAVARVRELLRTFEPFGKALDDVLPAREHALFVRRWNLFLHKLARASTYMSVHNFGQAHYYALSLRHELGAMAAIVDGAADNVVTSLHCAAAAGSAPWSLGATGAVALSALLLLGMAVVAVMAVSRRPRRTGALAKPTKAS